MDNFSAHSPSALRQQTEAFALDQLEPLAPLVFHNPRICRIKRFEIAGPFHHHAGKIVPNPTIRSGIKSIQQ
jgi:hypothetical protein